MMKVTIKNIIIPVSILLISASYQMSYGKGDGFASSSDPKASIFSDETNWLNNKSTSFINEEVDWLKSDKRLFEEKDNWQGNTENPLQKEKVLPKLRGLPTINEDGSQNKVETPSYSPEKDWMGNLEIIIFGEKKKGTEGIKIEGLTPPDESNSSDGISLRAGGTEGEGGDPSKVPVGNSLITLLLGAFLYGFYIYKKRIYKKQPVGL
jgi:hypothetical protein